MPQVLAADAFLARRTGVPIIDVRTTDEFAAGHIPGAINVPLFTNEERAEIGTIYQQQGRQPAVSLGLRCVGPRLAQLAQTLLDLTDKADPQLYIHCWRGGMRSGSVAWLMESTFGCRVATLRGGYKAFRRWVLDSFDLPRNVQVLAGLTGTGKTLILDHLAQLGATTVDLERLARHKGSAFGQLGEPAQPTQTQFENELAVAWRATPPNSHVWLEDESRTIGKCVLPEGLWQQKQSAPLHLIDVATDQRIAHLCATYAAFPPAQLAASVEVVRSRLGNSRTQTALDAIHCGDFATACRLLLTYYDRAYQNSLASSPPERIHRLDATTLTPATIAATLLDITRHPA